MTAFISGMNVWGTSRKQGKGKEEVSGTIQIGREYRVGVYCGINEFHLLRLRFLWEA